MFDPRGFPHHCLGLQLLSYLVPQEGAAFAVHPSEAMQLVETLRSFLADKAVDGTSEVRHRGLPLPSLAAPRLLPPWTRA